MKNTDASTLTALSKVIATVERLRAPGGCPWDREQTHQSLRKNLIEESYEVADVLDQLAPEGAPHSKQLKENFLEEWGDVLLQILLHAEISSEGNTFGSPVGLQEIAETLNNKLIVRHPHVFEKEREMTPAEVLEQWSEIKTKSKKASGASVFDGIKNGLPPIARTLATIKAVSAVGFQWDDWSGPLGKVEEETLELKQALSKKGLNQKQEIEDELGDLLFTVLNVAYLAKVDPEAALRGCLRKFERRFRHVETCAKDAGKELQTMTLQEMDLLWDQAKANEKQKGDLRV